MNDIPRGTSRAKLINSLLAPSHSQVTGGDIMSPLKLQPDVQFGLLMTDSKLDDEQSVAHRYFNLAAMAEPGSLRLS